AVDNQSAVTVHVVQGEREFAKDNKSLGMFNLEGIPAMRRGQAQIEVTFDIDANGIMNVAAKEKTTGKEQKVTIQGATNLSDEEIAAAKENAEKFAEEDKKKRELVESKNRLEQLTYQMENLKEENKDKLPEEEMKTIDKLIAEAKLLKEKDDATKEEIDKEIERMTQEFQTLLQKYQAQTQNTGGNPDEEIEDKSGNDKDGEVIEAE
ncbi:MAG: molecular chaperone DnaK, partial [candidate division SR1 bacterium]